MSSATADSTYRAFILGGVKGFKEKCRAYAAGDFSALTEEERGFFDALMRADPVSPAPEDMMTDEEVDELTFVRVPNTVHARDARRWLARVLADYALRKSAKCGVPVGAFSAPTRRNVLSALAERDGTDFARLAPRQRERTAMAGWNAINDRLCKLGRRTLPYPVYWKENGGTHEGSGEAEEKELLALMRAWCVENGVRASRKPQKREEAETPPTMPPAAETPTAPVEAVTAPPVEDTPAPEPETAPEPAQEPPQHEQEHELPPPSPEPPDVNPVAPPKEDLSWLC